MIDSLVAPEVEAALALSHVTKPQDNRITLMFADPIWEWIDEGVTEEGFNDNVSQYLAHLVRRDHEARVTRAIQLREHGARYGVKPKPSSSSSEDTQHKVTASLRREISKHSLGASSPKGKR